MKYIFIESGHFLLEWGKVRQLKSRLLQSAVETVDSAYWLIAGGRIAQALVMLDNAIELLLKGELERIHPILIAESRILADYSTLKSFLKDAFRQHPLTTDLTIPEVDIDRTILFETALERVAELYPELMTWRNRLLSKNNKDAIHNLRNEIVHHGGSNALEGRYTSAIIEHALPFIEEFLALLTRQEPEPIRLSHLLFEWVYREVGVAKAVLEDLRKNGLPPASYAITPLAHHILWTSAQWPHPTTTKMLS